MDDNKRNQEAQSGNKEENSTAPSQPASQQNTGSEAQENSQAGSHWNNYRTRELADNPDDAGNRGDNESGGSLY